MKRVDRRSTLLALLGVQLLIFIPGIARLADASSSFTFEEIMLQGEAAPGTETGTLFGPLFDGYFPTVPALDDAGNVFFGASLEGPSVTTSNRSGIWSSESGLSSLIARVGSQAPDLAPGAVFAGFPFDFAILQPSAGAGRMGFSGTLTGSGVTFSNDEGLWVRTAAGTHVLVREGQQAPGLAAGVALVSPFMLDINRAGKAFVMSSVNGPGISTSNDEAFWSDRSGSLALIVREGDQAPGLPAGVRFGGAGLYVGTGYSFESESWNNASRLGIQGNLTGPGVNTFNNEALFVERGGALALLAREGDHAPGFAPGVTFGGASVTADFGNIAFNALGHAGFLARTATSGMSTYAIYSDHTGALSLVAAPGNPAPGTDRDFGIVTDPILSDGGRIAFRAALSGGGSWPPLGLWWDQPGAAGSLVPVALPGDPAPGRPGATIVSVNFMFDFNAAGQLVFEATITDPTAGSREALYLAQPSGMVQEVVATGELFDAQGSAGGGSDLREVTTIRFGSMNASGELAIRLVFADGTTGAYAVSGAATSIAGTPATRGLRLAQNSPNPFGVSTRLSFALPDPAHVVLSVYDAQGRLVTRLLDEARAAGDHTAAWDGRDASGTEVASGVYWARLEMGEESQAVRMVLVRQ